jgi:DNA (cytosine-5)-methyltransferase 1
MKLLSLFSGIGAFEKALDRLAVPYELVNFSEIDKYAIKSYCAIHGVDESKNLGDITKVDETKLPNDIDLVTYGFPCQDISIAGKQKGLINEDGTQTRSGLFFEALRIIEATQPKVAIAENVKNLVGKKFNAQFQVVLASLESAGYNNYYKVLNAKDFGVPQNRERVFIVSIRKDIDTGKFEFPHPFSLEKRLKDVLEEVVEEKYYLNDAQITSIVNWKAQQKPFERVLGKESSSPTLTARGAGEYHSGMIILSQDNNDTCNMQNEIVDRFGIDKSRNNPRKLDIVNTLTAREDRGVSNRKAEGTAVCKIKQVGQRNGQGIIEPSLRIRKLTPKECFRLMGFDDESFRKAEAVNSSSQLYKQAGNSIVVDVLECLLCMMIDANGKFYV